MRNIKRFFGGGKCLFGPLASFSLLRHFKHKNAICCKKKKKKESGRDNYCASTGPAAFAAGREAENLVKNIVRIRRRECECGMAAKGKV